MRYNTEMGAAAMQFKGARAAILQIMQDCREWQYSLTDAYRSEEKIEQKN
jgi:hypothetical protein